jgi:cobalt-zinc-cadmium efflux system outer membrane protein
VDSLLRAADQGRPMITAGVLLVTEAELLARRARREIWPDIELGVAYGQRPMPEGGTDRMLSVMIGASVPIWAGSRQFRMRDETMAMQAMAQADLDAMRADTRGRVIEAIAELDRVRALSRRYRETIVPQAEATVASARSAYQVGSVDFMTLLDAVMTVNRYREEIYRLEAALGQAFAELEMLTGLPLVSGQPINPALRAGGQ